MTILHRGTFGTVGACLIALVPLFSACGSKNQVNPELSATMPKKIIWAWERPEDLRFLDPNEFGVAFLAQTLVLESDRVNQRSRRQPLELAPATYVIAVTRIETNKASTSRPKLDDEMVSRTVRLIKSTLELPDVRAIQIDFDAVVSERAFYRQLMNELKRQLPPEMPLTMTSLASWCTGDAWFNDFPVDEAVPMVFQMGADSEKIKTYLRNGNDWNEPLCRGSYGLSSEDGPFEGIRPGRRTYLFKNSSWNASDIAGPTLSASQP
jgi:hypothetical protein